MSDTDIRKHKDNWRNITKRLNDMKEGEDMTFDQLLVNLNITEQKYILAIRSSLNSPTIFLKREPNELRVNNYNSACLSAWRANMDIQFVLDVYACAMYIVSYISKAQKGMSQLLQRACDEAREGNSSIKQQVRDIGNNFLNSVEISAQEAVYIVLQLPMRKSSREVIFIPTAPSEERVQLLKPMNEIEELDDDSEEVHTSGLLNRYMQRSPSLENISLADWAAYYDSCQKPFTKKSRATDIDNLPLETLDNDENNDDELVECVKEVTNIGKQVKPKKRLKPRIIRSVWFNVDTHPEKHYRELIMLFTSWRNEETDLIGNSSSYQEQYFLLKEEIDKQMRQYAICSEDLNEIEQNLRSTNCSEEQFDSIAPNTQHIELEDEAEGMEDLHPDFNESYDMSDDLGIPSTSLNNEPLVLNELPDDDYRQMVQTLNKEQKEFFYHILHQIKTSETPFYCFLSGGAGVGKSHLTKAIYQAALKYYNTRAGDDFNQIKVILLAPTGKAAYTIKGNTVHSALAVPANQSLRNYKQLDSSRLNTLRSQFGGIKLIFVDEISMVGNSMFQIQLNNRLKDIKGCREDFGGVSIIAIGDLFQLEPVMDGYIFKDLRNLGYAVLAPSLWHKHFKMFELNAIMRQRDSKLFAELLNRLREGMHTPDDILKLKERVVQEDISNPIDAPHLFIQNAKVDEFNERAHNAATGNKFRINAQDSVIGANSTELRDKILRQIPNDPRKTKQLALNLCLAEGERTELAINIRTDDGLTNGAGNVIKLVQLHQQNKPSGTVWVQFDHSDVGQKTRNENRTLYVQGIEHTWTPIKPVTTQFSVGKNKTAQVVRKQFPLRPAAAKTIHRSQGDTETKIVVNFSTRRTIPHIHYVGLSRVTSIEGLHITDLCENKIAVHQDVKKEMERLRTSAKLQLCISPIYEVTGSLLKVCYLNARSVHKHIQDIHKDLNYSATDINIFAETRFSSQDSNDMYNVSGYDLFRNDNSNSNNGSRPYGGTAVYSRIPYLPGYPYCHNIHGVEITVIKITTHEDWTILGIYRSPKVPVRQLCQAMTELLNGISPNNNIILGDFNINWLVETERRPIYNLLVRDNRYKQLISSYTTDNKTLIDHIYTNILHLDIQSGVLKTYFTDHKAVWASFHTM